jgi:hypothetical protein
MAKKIPYRLSSKLNVFIKSLIPFFSIFTAIVVSTKSLPTSPKHMVGTGWNLGGAFLGGKGEEICR